MGFEFRLEFGKGRRTHDIELHGEQAQADAPARRFNDMAMRVDQAGEQGAAAAIHLTFDRASEFLGALDELFDLALVIDDQPAKSLELAVHPDLDAVDVVDERVGECS